jgi:predicted MPP superfamily phosphohydrolase
MRISLAIMAFFAIASAATAEPVYFAQLTDTHLSANKEWQRTEKAIAAINQLPFPLSCVVVTGDVFSDNYKDLQALKRAKALFARLKMPCHVIAGNHDYNPSDVASQSNWQETFGPFFQAATYGGVGFAFVNTVPLGTLNQILPYKPLEELRAYLKKDPARPVLVFNHIPSSEDFYENTVHFGWPAKNEEEWEKVLSIGNVKAVIAGHFHRNELHWIAKKIPLFVSPPIAGHWQRQASFRVYKYEDGRLGYYTVYLE